MMNMMMNIEELRKNFCEDGSMLCALKMEILLVITALCVWKEWGCVN